MKALRLLPLTVAFIVGVSAHNEQEITRIQLLNALQDYLSGAKQDIHYNETARVRQDVGLAKQESEFVKARLVHTQNALSKFTGVLAQKVPTIALCGSGGGYRAMIAMLGFLMGAQEIGLLDSTTYVAGLSGSTWALTSWLLHERNLQKTHNAMRQAVSRPLQEDFAVSRLVQVGLQKMMHGQKLSLVGIWGELLSNRLLYDLPNRNSLTLSHVANLVSDGTVPLPICTAVSTDSVLDGTWQYHWFEFTPFEIGCECAHSFVPTWAFGRLYSAGRSKKYVPESPIAFYLGVWGSAFTAALREILNNYSKAIPAPLFNGLEIAVNHSNLGELRLSPAHFNPITTGLTNSCVSGDEQLTLVDAGFACNIPIPVLLNPARQVDLIIICDASADVKGAPELKLAQKYAHAHRLKFPPINYDGIENHVLSVFTDKNDPSVPTVIYMPLIKNSAYSQTFDPVANINSNGYCSTFNFIYNNDQFNQLLGLTRYNVVSNRAAIRDAITALMQ